MNCPKCGLTMVYRNRDFGDHGYYCSDKACRGWIVCNKWCCSVRMQICPRCFGSGNWPWAQWGGPIKCSACDGTGKVSGAAFANLRSAPEDRRNPSCPPRPGMIWSTKHKMWIDVDRSTPEEKAFREKVAADVEAELERSKREGKSS